MSTASSDNNSSSGARSTRSANSAITGTTGATDRTDTSSLRRKGALVVRSTDDINDRNRHHVNLKTLQKSNHTRSDAITELELIYDELNQRLSDSDLLDRAERRDLPYRHQLYWTNDCNNNDVKRLPQINGHEEVDGEHDDEHYSTYTTATDYEWFDKRRSMATIAALDALRNDYNGRGFTDRFALRSRTPPSRRSAIPDIIRDDYAFRRYNRSLSQSQLCPSTGPQEIRGFNSIKRINNNKHYSMSYLMTTASSDDSLYYDNTSDDYQNPIYTNDSDLKYLSQANIKVDDLSNRWIRQASVAGVLPPHPPFGIPNTVVSHSSPNDYIRVEMDPKVAAKVRYRCRSGAPHLVHDDMAFRSLRKDSKVTNTVLGPTAPPPPLRSMSSMDIKKLYQNQRPTPRPRLTLSASLV